MIQFAFLFLVACGNFVIGVGVAYYLGKAPRDWRFLTQLLEAVERRRAFVGSPVADSNPMMSLAGDLPEVESPKPVSKPAAPANGPPAATEAEAEVALEPTDTTVKVDEPVSPDDPMPEMDVDQSPGEGPATQLALAELIIDMAAQEVHLGQLGEMSAGDQGRDDLDWESVMSDINDDIQKLLRKLNEARYLVEQRCEVAADAGQTCLGELDVQWDAINNHSIQLLVISSEPDWHDAVRHQLADICEGVLTASHDARQSCAAYLAHESLERPLVST